MTFSFLFSPSAHVGKAAAIALSALLMTACATITPPTDDATMTQPALNRTYSDAINLEGRLSVQYQLNDKDESVHGSFTWQQTAQRTAITLLSPLGQIIAKIDVTPESATLTQSDRDARTAPDVDELAAQSLGWPLPVSGLRTWLQGFAINSNGQKFVATPTNNKVTTRDGWQINYVTWDDSNPAQPHPKRIDLQRQTEQAGNVVMRIIVDQSQAR